MKHRDTSLYFFYLSVWALSQFLSSVWPCWLLSESWLLILITQREFTARLPRAAAPLLVRENSFVCCSSCDRERERAWWILNLLGGFLSLPQCIFCPSIIHGFSPLVVAAGNLFYLNDSGPCLPVLVDVLHCPPFPNTFISLCVWGEAKSLAHNITYTHTWLNNSAVPPKTPHTRFLPWGTHTVRCHSPALPPCRETFNACSSRSSVKSFLNLWENELRNQNFSWAGKAISDQR